MSGKCLYGEVRYRANTRDRRFLNGYDTQTMEDLRRIIEVVGQLPRVLFDHILDSEDHIRITALDAQTRLIKKMVNKTLQIMATVGTGFHFEMMKDHFELYHSVLFLRPYDGIDICKWGTNSLQTVASPHVARQFVEQSKDIAGDQMTMYLGILTAFSAGSSIGYIFEGYVHGNLEQLRGGECHLLPLANRVAPSSAPTQPFTITKDLSLEEHVYTNTQHLLDIITKITKTNPTALHNTYFRPESKTSPAVDAFIVDNQDTLVFLQMTVGKTLDVKSSGLTEVLSCLDQYIKKFVLVFIVPDKDEFRTTRAPITPPKPSQESYTKAYKQRKDQLEEMPQYVFCPFGESGNGRVWGKAWKDARVSRRSG